MRDSRDLAPHRTGCCQWPHSRFLRIPGLVSGAVLALLSASLGARPADAAEPIRILGRVAAPSGGSLPAAVRVELLPQAEGDAEALARLAGEEPAPLAAAAPLPDGSYVLAAPGPGVFRVSVRAAGYVPLESEPFVLVEEREMAPAELPPASPLRVLALGPDGKPAAGVVLLATDQDCHCRAPDKAWFPAPRRGTTGADGAALFARAPGEKLDVVATSPAFLGQRLAGAVGDATLRLRAALRAALAVRTPQGRPAAGALARLCRVPWPAVAAAGRDGLLVVAVAPGERLCLLLDDRGGSAGLAQVSLSAPRPARAGQAVSPVAVALDPSRPIEGRILDAADRAPLPGAVVRLLNLGSPFAPFAVAGADGGFRLSLPPLALTAAGERASLEAAAAGHVPAITSPDVAPAAAAAVLLLAPAGEVRGQVVDAAGQPLAGVAIWATSTSGHGGEGRDHDLGSATARSGRHGRFRLPALRRGAVYRLLAEREGFSPALALATALPPAAAEPVRIALTPARMGTGRVVDGDGRPLAGAEVTLNLLLRDPAVPSGVAGIVTRRATSDEAGRFEIGPLAAGRAELAVRLAGSAELREALNVPPGDSPFDLGDLALATAVPIAGRVFDERGRPVADAEIDAAGEGFDQAVTGPDGAFRIDTLPGGRFHLTVRHAEHPQVELEVDSPLAEPLRIELPAGGALTGRVLGPSGEPVAGASFVVQPLGEAGSGESGRPLPRSDREGRFRLAGLAAGRFALQVSAAGCTPLRLTGLEVPVGRELDLGDLVLDRAAAVEGRVLRADGAPAPGVTVVLTSFLGFRPTGAPGPSPVKLVTRTDAEGRFRQDGLEPRKFKIWAEAPDGERSAELSLDVQPGTQSVELTLAPSFSISGRVRDEEGAPATAWVQLIAAGGALQLAASGPDGVFSFSAVPAGEYRLRAARSPSPPGAAGNPESEVEVRVEGASVEGVELALAPAPEP